MLIKIINLASSTLLPILVWQTYWFNNIYAANMLNFLIWFIFIFTLLGLIGLSKISEEKKLEIKVTRRKSRFNNNNVDIIVKCLDVASILVLVAFNGYLSAILLIATEILMGLYLEELNKI